ncbi:hypothetical protein [Methanococcoides seepicolus]|uniref:Uncharacterized protein n=1 Tax=Methanococcoides seepicolus TaxID=2828780 RepID=A0A9E4ZEV0_9EURY|nr:hypothetical protein [Methanococcoides seepicolus]MCM1986296.1 hypothetical protein [Methanococcoides seepicolus]
MYCNKNTPIDLEKRIATAENAKTTELNALIENVPMPAGMWEPATKITTITAETILGRTIAVFIIMGLADYTLPYSIKGNCANRVMERGLHLGVVTPKDFCIGCGKFTPSFGMDYEIVEDVLCDDPIALEIADEYIKYLLMSGEFADHVNHLKEEEVFRNRYEN